MPVPGESPCPLCGHPRRSPAFGDVVGGGGERSSECECSIPIVQPHLEWDPNAEPQAIDWSSALDFILLMVEMGTSCTEFVLGATPAFAIAPDELQDLAIAEQIVRDMWARYLPATPALRTYSSVAAENAAVDAYENAKAQLGDALRNIPSSDSWRNEFSILDHAAIEQLRRIITARGGAV